MIIERRLYMIKPVAFILILALVIPFFTACSQTQDTPSDTTAVTSSLFSIVEGGTAAQTKNGKPTAITGAPIKALSGLI